MANVKASQGGEDLASGATKNANGGSGSNDKIVKTTPASLANSTSSGSGESGAGGGTTVPTLTTATTAGNYLGQKLKAAQVEGLGAGNDLHGDVR